jgi:hypothetical protein
LGATEGAAWKIAPWEVDADVSSCACARAHVCAEKTASGKFTLMCIPEKDLKLPFCFSKNGKWQEKRQLGPSDKLS